MTRYYCDLCGNEMPKNEHGRLIRRYACVTVEIIHAVGGTWNLGQVCHACIIRVVNEGTPINQAETPK